METLARIPAQLFPVIACSKKDECAYHDGIIEEFNLLQQGLIFDPAIQKIRERRVKDARTEIAWVMMGHDLIEERTWGKFKCRGDILIDFHFNIMKRIDRMNRDFSYRSELTGQNPYAEGKREALYEVSTYLIEKYGKIVLDFGFIPWTSKRVTKTTNEIVHDATLYAKDKLYAKMAVTARERSHVRGYNHALDNLSKMTSIV